jgi:hypothetical protein
MQPKVCNEAAGVRLYCRLVYVRTVVGSNENAVESWRLSDADIFLGETFIE